ncbi:tetratricopeptide repeat protein [Nostoc sp. DedQUE05]
MNKFLEINSEHIDALYNRGAVYYQQKQYQLALNDYNRVISLSL